DMPSDPPSTPNHQHRADWTTLQSEGMTGVRDARLRSLPRKHWSVPSPDLPIAALCSNICNAQKSRH
ncbi:MAG: hypothetical protein AAGD43_30565, partial [Pseudomonadota bacterium]